MEQPLGFLAAVRQVYSRTFQFGGRARRAEFWWFFLFGILMPIGLSIIDLIVFGAGESGQCDMIGPWGEEMIFSPGGANWCFESDGGPLNNIFALLNIVPWLSLWSRRLHDLNRSFWWLLLIFLPVIGWIVLFIFALSRGTIGENQFGADPATTPQAPG